MGTISVAVLFGSIGLIVFGLILGAIRGKNRSILRIILILLCAVIAFFMKDIIVNILLNIKLKSGLTLQTELLNTLIADDASATQMAEVFLLIIKTLLTLVAFVGGFFVLQLLSWIVVFPICKLFVKKDINQNGEYQNQAGVGAIVGVVQGVLIALLVFAPITGMLIQVDKVIALTEQLDVIKGDSQVESLSLVDEEIEVSGYGITTENYALLTNSPDMGAQSIREFTTSGIAKFYNDVGGWLFDAVSKTKDEEGHIITFSGAVDTVDLIITVVDEISVVSSEIENIDLSSPTNALNAMGDSFINIGEKTKNLGESGKVIFDKMIDGIKEMAKEEIGEQADLSFIDEINFESLDLVAVGSGMKALSSVVDTGVVSQEQANEIVNAFATNQVVLTMVDGVTICDLSGESEQTFKTAIESYNFSSEEKARLCTLFGIN